MAKKRMFTLDVVNSDAFLDLPLSSQSLYFQLAMRADDDGFIGNPKRMTAYLGASPDDLKLLIANRFLLDFPSGVVCIKHWKMHNTLKNDRIEPTVYQEELGSLFLKPNKSYTDHPAETECFQNVSKKIPSVETKCFQKDSIDIDIGEVKDSYREDIEKESGQTEAYVALDKNLLTAFIGYKAFRKSAGKPLTTEQQIALINKLNAYPEADRLEIIVTATERGWMSFFPLDKKRKQESSINKKIDNPNEDEVLKFVGRG